MLIFRFPSANIAMKAKFLLKDITGVKFIPLPPEIDSECGLALKILEEDCGKIREILDGEGISYRVVE